MINKRSLGNQGIKAVITVIFLVAVILAGRAVESATIADARPKGPTQGHTLSGRVYAGDLGVEPPGNVALSGVTVSLYCSNNAGSEGTLLRSTTTNDQGWYGLAADEICEYYNIIETNPAGYTSTGATTVSGTVIGEDWIEYTYPLEGKTLSGNKFWDKGPPTNTPTATHTPTPTATPTKSAPPTLTPDVCEELLDNGDFETGDPPPWSTYGMVGMGPGRDSEHGMQLGGTDNAGGELFQAVTIPRGNEPVQLRFWWLAESEVEQPDDAVDVIVQYDDEQADHLYTVRALEPLGQWRMETLDLSDYADMEVLVTFLVHTDDEVPSMFRLDDISLQACGTQPFQPSQSTWEFSGVVVDENDDPLEEMEVRLLGSAVAGRAGQFLDWSATNADGAFTLRVDQYDGDALTLPYIQVALLSPGHERIWMGSESGGEVMDGGWLEFSEPQPDHYGGNIFKVQPPQPQGAPPLRLCAIADTFVEQGQPATNHGADAYITTGYYNRGCGGACRLLARFNMDWVPAGSTITAAKFQAYQEYAGGRTTADVRAYRITNQWDENTANWSNQPSVGAPSTTVSLGTSPGYRTWDTTDLVAGWRNGNYSNHGLELQGAEQNPEWWRDFRSRETSNPPRLVLHRSGIPSVSGTIDANKPSITISPYQGEAGSVFWVRGYNLKAATTLDLFWDVRKTGNQLAQVQTDGLGTFGVQVAVPAGALPGFHPVLLYWQDTIEQVNVLQDQLNYLVEPNCWSNKPPLDLNPQITISPTQGPSNGGNTVQVQGKGWSANSSVKLYWDYPALCSGNNTLCLGQVTTDSKGKFLTSFTVPAYAAATDHLVVAHNHPFTVPVQQAAATYRMIDPPSPPANDNLPPTVFVSHSIDHLYSGGPPATLYFQANAWDPPTSPTSYNGIIQVDIWAWPVTGSYPLIHKTCQVTGWTPSMLCMQKENGPWDSSIAGFYYFAQARDRANNLASSPVKVAWLINDGPDADNDGLSDRVEKAICTNPNNPDSDRDNLLDGWEVEGITFADGHYLDLPSMGAHPCMQDMFVEVDWTPGRNPNPAQDFQPVINAFQNHGIRLHIDYGQWGGGSEVTLASTTAANVAARNNFDPHRLWAFHYAVFRAPIPGRATNFCERGKVFFIGDASHRAEIFMHELGHCTGLGHGGMEGANSQKRSGSVAQQKQWGFQWVWYDQDSVATNNKPNYLSVMNYNWNGLVYVPAANCAGTNCFVFIYDYSEKALPTLDESKLDERASSAFVQELRSYPLPTGAPAGGVPLSMYACTDPDENDALYGIATDGHQMIGRFKAGDPWPGGWQFSNLPAQDKNGIDWDCDGTIESSVSGEINGCSGQCFFFHTPQTKDEKLTGANDWVRIPSFDPCPGDSWLGQGFLKSALNPPCESNGWSTASSYPPIDRPWRVAPPAEYCNGEDDDDDGLIDEGCADSDGDDVVDDLDNCPLLFNPEQGDADQDMQGDACSKPPPPPGGLTIERLDELVHLRWDPVDALGVVGYDVYRRLDGELVYRFMGESWPATELSEYVDEPPTQIFASYFVRTVNHYGLESEASEPLVIHFGYPLYLPLMEHGG